MNKRLEKRGQRNPRLYPSLFNSRYYHRTCLRKGIASIADRYLSKKNKKLLVDFGCGTMPYRSIFCPYTSQYVGVDLPENKEADRHLSEDGISDLGDNFTDVVLSTQVLEHVKTPKEYLRECFRILKNDGLLILSTHGYWMYHPDPTDFWRWTSSGLKKELSEVGFHIIHFQGLMGLASTGLQLFQDASQRKIPHFIRPIYFIIMQFIIFLLDRLHSKESRAADACSFLLVAKKQKIKL